MRSQPVYGLGGGGRARPRSSSAAVAALAAAGIAHDFAPEPLLPGWGVNAMPPGVSKWSGIEAFCAAGRGVARGGARRAATARTTSRCWSVPHGRIVVAGSRAAARVPGAEAIAPPERDGWADLAARLLG